MAVDKWSAAASMWSLAAAGHLCTVDGDSNRQNWPE